MSRKPVTGICHICGLHKKLSFEHVPPESAFNKHPVVLYEIQNLICKNPENLPKGKKLQRGSGQYTLCEKCNNLTGHWYGSAFSDWAYQGMNVLGMTRGSDPLINIIYNIFPLRIIKQIICMFFSANGDGFREAHPDLEEFIMSPKRKYLKPSIKIYAFYNLAERPRMSGITGQLSIYGHQNIFCEIAFPPIGYIMTIDSNPPAKKLTDITYFANYDYNDWKHIDIKMHVLPVFSYLPADYRTKDSVMQAWRNG